MGYALWKRCVTALPGNIAERREGYECRREISALPVWENEQEKVLESLKGTSREKMKAMKKFKVIEESRFLNKQNLKQIVGGKCIGDTNFTICEPGAQLAGGFSTNPMCPGQLRWGTCDIGWDYQGAGACFNNFVTEPCSAKKQYIGPIAPPLG